MGEKISTILELIDMGSMALPEFQRGYVWNRDQVKALIGSLYKGYPVGSLLVWQTQSAGARSRNNQQLNPGVVSLLLDGQQRITSLYGVIKGCPPKFFEGDKRAFTDLYFNIESEEFEFYAPIKMAQDRLWISVTDLMKKGATGLGEIIAALSSDPATAPKIAEYSGRVAKLLAIASKEVHSETVAGGDKTIEVVVDIFNRVNSGGTKLSKGDLALARISAGRPETRAEMKNLLGKWREHRYNFDLDWLLRNMNAIVTGEAKFSYLHELGTEEVRDGLARAERSIEAILTKIADRLGLDHDQVFFGKGAIPLLAHYVDKRGASSMDAREWDRLLFWYVQVAMKGRYSGSTESFLDRDLAMVENLDGGIERLIQEVAVAYGGLSILPEHFSGWSVGARFYPVLYMLTRVMGARDFGNGNAIRRDMLGRNSGLEVHHIFPKAQLYDLKYGRAEVNAVANFCFLTKDSNIAISDRKPEEYFPEVEARFPGALKSQWIPMDERLWKLENYKEFLDARKRLLAEAANALLVDLYHEALPTVSSGATAEAAAAIPGSILDEQEEAQLASVNAWVVEHGLPEGIMSFEMSDPETGRPIAILDLAWPDGLQQGLSRPVALLLGESSELVMAIKRRDFLVFSDAGEFKAYVKKEVLAGLNGD